MASIYLRGKVYWGKWYREGRMQRQSLKTRDKAEARRRLRAMGVEMSSAPWIPKHTSTTTWEEASADLMAYYQAYGSRNIGEATYRLKRLSTYFRCMKLAAIDASVVLAYVAHRKTQDKAPATINVELSTLKQALRLAQELGKLERVPPIRMLKPSAPRSGFFERVPFEAVAQALPVDLSVVVRIAYTYGWRIDSEVLTLAWRQVDLQTGTLRLDPGSTKNKDGRLVYLTPELKAVLAEQLARVRELERELSEIIPWVFPTPYGPYKGQRRKDFVKSWQKACRQAGCLGMLKHDLRRTAARNMIAAGVSERVTMAVMGHKTASMLHRYCIVSPGDLQAVAQRLSSQTTHGHNLGTGTTTETISS